MKQHHEPERHISDAEIRAFVEKGWSYKTKADVEKYFNDNTNDIMQNADQDSLKRAWMIGNEYRRNLDNPVQTLPTREVAGRYHFLLLDHLARTKSNPSYSEKEATFRKFEAKYKQIEQGIITDEELKFLQSLPSLAEWSKDGDNNRPSIEKMYESGYFGELPEDGNVMVAEETDEATRIINKIVATYPEDLKDEVRTLYSQMLRIYVQREGKEKGLEVFKNNDKVKEYLILR
jgi:hypothetical protein